MTTILTPSASGGGGGITPPADAVDTGEDSPSMSSAVGDLQASGASSGQKFASMPGAILASNNAKMSVVRLDLKRVDPGTITRRAGATTGGWVSGQGVLLPDVGYLTFDDLGAWYVGGISVDGKITADVGGAASGDYMGLGYLTPTGNYMLAGGASYDGAWKEATMIGTSTTISAPLLLNNFTMPAALQVFADMRKTDGAADGDASFVHGVIVPVGSPAHRGSLSGFSLAQANQTDGLIALVGKGGGSSYLTSLIVKTVEVPS